MGEGTVKELMKAEYLPSVIFVLVADQLFPLFWSRCGCAEERDNDDDEEF